MSYTASDICRAIKMLNKNRNYGYINPTSTTEIRILNVIEPEGPIRIKRRKAPGAKWEEICISTPMLWRLANALDTGLPVNVDRVFAGSYNTRSALEALVAYTPEIFTCTPGRQECIGNQVKIKKGHKHIILRQNMSHELGTFTNIDLGENYVVSEIPSHDISYDVTPFRTDTEMDINILRKHSQMQVALAEVANAMGIRTWLAVEDHQILYNGKTILEYPFIVKDLTEEATISNFHEAINVGKHIDCLYFNGGLPFAFEVEHTTGVTTGLARMMQFKNNAQHLNTKYVIVAPDDDRANVLHKASVTQFRQLNPYFFPYSHLEELYSFVKRYHRIQGVDVHEFLLTFMEAI